MGCLLVDRWVVCFSTWGFGPQVDWQTSDRRAALEALFTLLPKSAINQITITQLRALLAPWLELKAHTAAYDPSALTKPSAASASKQLAALGPLVECGQFCEIASVVLPSNAKAFVTAVSQFAAAQSESGFIYADQTLVHPQPVTAVGVGDRSMEPVIMACGMLNGGVQLWHLSNSAWTQTGESKELFQGVPSIQSELPQSSGFTTGCWQDMQLRSCQEETGQTGVCPHWLERPPK